MNIDLSVNPNIKSFISNKSMLWIPFLYFLYPVIIFLIKGSVDLFTGLIPFFSFFIWYRYRKIDISPEKITISSVIFDYKIQEIYFSKITKVLVLKQNLLTNSNLFIQYDNKEIVLAKADWPNYGEIVVSVGQYVNITYVDSNKELVGQTKMHQDIGKIPLYLVLISVVILVFSLYLTSHLKALHLFTEPSDKLLILFFPIGLFISYLTLRNSKKDKIWLTSLVCGLLLGGSLNFMVLQINRLLNESKPNIQYHDFQMIGSTNDGFQKWKPIKPDDIKFQGEWFGINPIWKGYAPATLGDIRSFPIIHGFLNDLAVHPSLSKPVKIEAKN